MNLLKKEIKIMIYIITALYIEAEPFIKHFNLKKNFSFRLGQFFEPHTVKNSYNCKDTPCSILITGTGEIHAAAAVSALFSSVVLNSNDILINCGVAGGPDSLSGTYLISKITEESTGREFYPDLYYSVPFEEQTITTVSSVSHSIRKNLTDMESAAIFQVCLNFFSPERMIFLKKISDHGENVSKMKLINTISEMFSEILPLIISLSELTLENTQCKKVQSSLIDNSSINNNISFSSDKICTDMLASETMSHEIEQIITYLKAANISIDEFFIPYYQDFRLPVKTRREGKEVLKSFYDKL